jgi:hypothetical protein
MSSAFSTNLYRPLPVFFTGQFLSPSHAEGVPLRQPKAKMMMKMILTLCPIPRDLPGGPLLPDTLNKLPHGGLTFC